MNLLSRNSQTMVTRLCFMSAIIAEIAGLFHIAIGVYFLVKYLGAQDGVERSQFAGGVAMGITYAFGLFLLTTLLLAPVRPYLPKRLYKAMVLPTVITSGLFLVGCLIMVLLAFDLVSI